MATKVAKASAKVWEADLQFHTTLLAIDGLNVDDRVNNVHLEEIRTTPLFSGDVLANVLGQQAELGAAAKNVLPEYGLLAKVLDTFDGSNSEGTDELLELGPQNLVNTFGEEITDERPGSLRQIEDKRLFVNMNAPCMFSFRTPPLLFLYCFLGGRMYFKSILLPKHVSCLVHCPQRAVLTPKSS